MPTSLTTFHAPPDRAPHEVVLEQYQAFVGSQCRAFFDALPTMILVLNCARQIVFANLAAVRFLGHDDVLAVLGNRPGEVLGCVNADLAPSGCGTSRHCRQCGMVSAIMAALDGHANANDCQLLRRESEYVDGLDLHAVATPLSLDTHLFIIFALSDISHENRRRSMERIFFHDVLNLAGGINGLVELLRSSCPSDHTHELGVLHSATQTLVDEIVSQRELLAAENKDLHPTALEVTASDILVPLKGLYEQSPAAQGQTLELTMPLPDGKIVTDPILVQRVLGNMLKNAFEAGQHGDTVTLSCADEGDLICFVVRNSAVMPPEVQENMFHRRFSTKGASRGLGTYSMLLLAERYLGGSVGFASEPELGTTFFLRLPKRVENA